MSHESNSVELVKISTYFDIVKIAPFSWIGRVEDSQVFDLDPKKWTRTGKVGNVM